MAQIWFRAEDESEDDDEGSWSSVPVPDDRFVAVDRLPGRQKPRLQGKRRFDGTKSLGAPCDRLILVRTGSQTNEVWHVLSFRGVPFRVNGRVVREGIAPLKDRSELRFEPNGPRWFVSLERRARPEVLSRNRQGTCPRCQRPLVRGQTVVACPVCSTLHHQDESENLGCWLYAGKGCVSCGARAVLDDEVGGWRPDER